MNSFRYERQLLAAVRAFAVVTLNDLIGRLQFYVLIKNCATLIADNQLRHNITAVRVHFESGKMGVKEKLQLICLLSLFLPFLLSLLPRIYHSSSSSSSSSSSHSSSSE